MLNGNQLGDPNRLAVYTQIAQHDELSAARCMPSTLFLGHSVPPLEGTDRLGLITFRKEGLNVYYRSVPEKLAEYLQYLTSIGTQIRR